MKLKQILIAVFITVTITFGAWHQIKAEIQRQIVNERIHQQMLKDDAKFFNKLAKKIKEMKDEL